jgi:hypothetical protein
MKEIPLNRGYKALIDDEDFPLISQYTWCVRTHRDERTPYACTEAKGKYILMHKLITGYSMTDHKNNNGLDNRRENLRVGTTSTNKMNAPKQRGNYTSQYKGVSKRRTRKGGWIAVIYLNRRQHYIGEFKTETEAAKAYDDEASRLFGEYAHLNFPNSA